MTSPRLSHRHTVAAGDPPDAPSCLAKATGLSKGAVKEAMAKGAVWVTRGRSSGTHRLRRVKAAVRPGDVLEIHHDPALLALTPPDATLVRDAERWTAWWKPHGLLSQGTPFGDHYSLLRQVEVRLARPVYLVHRLDREAAGLLLIAHDAATAAALSALFHDGKVEKRYRAEVAGDPRDGAGSEGVIEEPLDGKRAVTRWKLVSVDPAGPSATLDVFIETGRQHQIRRHLAGIGHPVIGDPRYGTGRPGAASLRLTAVGLGFRDPGSGEEVVLSEPAR